MADTTNQSALKSPRRMAREPKPDIATNPDTASLSNVAGVTAPAASNPPPEKKQTKIALVLELLSRPEGATLDQLVATTGWQAHTMRAALTGLKKKGYTIERRSLVPAPPTSAPDMQGTSRTTRAEIRLAGEIARLGTLSPAELRREWKALAGIDPPNLGTALLRRLLAQRLQEKRLGALPVMVMRELERTNLSGPVPAAVGSTTTLAPGARMIREWRGRTIAVLTTEKGFIWEDREYRSLSKIAHEVTGAHWSGPRFFGLTGNG